MIPSQTQLYLESFIDYERYLDQAQQKTFKLERMQNLLNALENPQKNLKIIHVAGSKGKGSICALIGHILKESGFRVGLYTSPHINGLRERIRILDKQRTSPPGDDLFEDMITEGELEHVLHKAKPVLEQLRNHRSLGALSFFEVYTAVALCFFRDHNTDFVVLETGVGGRLDATNAADSVMAVLTPISLEHTHLLGSSIEAIAREKAAIIKNPRQHVVIAPQGKPAERVFKGRCAQFGITPVSLDPIEVKLKKQTLDGQVVDVTTGNVHIRNVTFPLSGRHQRENCVVAIGAVNALEQTGNHVDHESLKKGIERVRWPLRFETVSQKPLVILDGAHDLRSMNALMELVDDVKGARSLKVLFGVSRGKNTEAMLERLRKRTDDITFIKADHPRALDLPGALKVRDAVEQVWNETDKLVLVTGSMYAASEARRHIMERQLCTS